MEELTTKMHAEFIEGEINEFDLRVMGVYACISRGEGKEESLKKYELTSKEYDENIDRVLTV